METQILTDWSAYLAEPVGRIIGMNISGFAFGLILATALNFLGYGIFKAISLLNIK